MSSISRTFISKQTPINQILKQKSTHYQPSTSTVLSCRSNSTEPLCIIRVQKGSFHPQTSGQSPNRVTTWSKNQGVRSEAMKGPRFEQTAMDLQPFPLAAIDLIHQQPISMVSGRVASCDGGGGALGHPRIFINLDKPGYHPCSYCGLRFEQEAHDHH
ncbi:uncharacterized protein MELLADRAFT_101543 [Melampsora larici-populina 98AG31]|uniref:Zinc finger CHCC-type domain-containing protein n=1 Tax=Melampsora larici-populina (strain 98AG31 / pathotype 3-4-7) TaxID=747676 RepID=F4R666_MELLP|nr:uncharacterized protein MELLADRAFT_101543 [Melampsora larici-populina 98AG31]EGG11831.1 hypothetical protein MELLADRAFT_101543 [Melampsora larici-populina 98AG31]